jgi:hypothetical protein
MLGAALRRNAMSQACLAGMLRIVGLSIEKAPAALNPSKNGFQVASARCWLNPWNTMAILIALLVSKVIYSPQWGLSRLSR